MLLAAVSRQRRVGTGRSASLVRSRFASTALRCSVLRPVAQLAAFTAFTPLRQGATRMLRTRFALAASPALLGAPEARCAQCPHAFAVLSLVFGDTANHVGSRQAVPGGGDLWGGEKRRFAVGARSALRNHSRRACLSEANAVRVASCATHPLGEHRRAVDAKRDRPSMSRRRAAPAAMRAIRAATGK